MKQFGLTTAEAEESKQQYGDNRLSEVKGEGFLRKLIGNFKDPMICILLVALLVNIGLTVYNAVAHGHAEWYEPVSIACAILIATLVSTFSEYRNENAFQKLQEEASRITCKVIRDGEVVELLIDDLVVGDCLMLQAGDKIPADGVLVDGAIAVDQSVLNGESAEAKKVACTDDYQHDTADLLDRHSVYRGAVVTNGVGVMRVEVVGDKSVYGAIAGALQQEDDRPSPLKHKLSKLAKGISYFGYIGGALIAITFLLIKFVGQHAFDPARIAAYFAGPSTVIVADVISSVMLAVVIIVMAVPEGLPLMIALVSALNMRKMLRDNVLVRKIVGIETAGSLNILFSDKTGTITRGLLEVVTFIDGAGTIYPHNAIPYSLCSGLVASIRNNGDAVLTGKAGEERAVGGNATERALLNFAKDYSFVAETALDHIPFNSTIKYSATTTNGGTYLKGAAERILALCADYIDENGNLCPLDKDKLLALMDEQSERAMRMLGFASCSAAIVDGALPKDAHYTWLGMVGIRDEVRPEAVVAIRDVQEAGVQVVMITGDRKETAVAIAKDAGILREESDVVLTSAELNAMTDEEIKAVLPALRVVARALPTDKSRLVGIAQSLDLVVGMTGDGVNDSPALKKADVGFAMGGGTEVAKEAGDIVILDDNFSTIAKAILYGRTIFNNIRKFIVFQLTINVAAVLTSFICPLVGPLLPGVEISEPLSIIQILWINLIMDTLAALAFGGEPALSQYMDETPKRRAEPIVSKTMWTRVIVGGLWIVGMGLVLMLVPSLRALFGSEKVMHTAFFTYFVFACVFNGFNARSEGVRLLQHLSRNKGYILCMSGVVVIQIILTFLGGDVFSCYGLNAAQFFTVLGLSLSVIPLDILRKVITRLVERNEQKVATIA